MFEAWRGFPSCCFLAVAPNILDFWQGLAHRGEEGAMVLCYPGVCLRDGGMITVQSSGANRGEQCPVGYRREGVSLCRNGLCDWSYSSHSPFLLPSSCSPSFLQCPETTPQSGGAHGAELRLGELVQSSLQMALHPPELLVGQEELAGLPQHMTHFLWCQGEECPSPWLLKSAETRGISSWPDTVGECTARRPLPKGRERAREIMKI